MRSIFVGDIQGCGDQLRDLLGALGYQPASDVLYPVGDLVNKGPDSEGVLGLLMQLDARPVIGNHDLYWLEHGLVRDPKAEAWLRAQPVVRVLEDVILIHAGLHPKWAESHLESLNAQGRSFAVTVRYCDAEGNRPPLDWPPPSAPFHPWDHFYKGRKRVVFGHWARRGLVHTERVVGLDTGCVYGNKLSAWIAEEDRIVQVPGWKG